MVFNSFLQRIKKLWAQADELYLLRRKVYMNFIEVDCTEVNEMLRLEATGLANKLTSFLVDRNRDLNKESVFSIQYNILCTCNVCIL